MGINFPPTLYANLPFPDLQFPTDYGDERPSKPIKRTDNPGYFPVQTFKGQCRIVDPPGNRGLSVTAQPSKIGKPVVYYTDAQRYAQTSETQTVSDDYCRSINPFPSFDRKEIGYYDVPIIKVDNQGNPR